MSSSRLGVVRAVLVTILVQPTINAASLAWNEERAAPGVRGQQILHDLGEHLAVALAFVGLVTLWRRCGPRRSWHGWLASTVGLVVLAIPTIGEDAAGFVARFESDAIAGMLRWVVIAGVAVAVVAAALLGRHRGRRGLAGVATVVGVAVLVGNHTILDLELQFAPNPVVTTAAEPAAGAELGGDEPGVDEPRVEEPRV